MKYLFPLLILGFTTAATAEVPKLLHYQGYLQGVDGTPIHCPSADDCVVDAGIAVTFQLYPSQEAEKSFWSETHDAVAVHEGVFNLTLGSVTPLETADFDTDAMYLGITINGGDELEPRQKFVSAAFAIRADWAGLAADANRLGALIG